MTDRVINRSSKRITQKYNNNHKGIDLGYNSSNEEENKVYANSKGTVIEVVNNLEKDNNARGAKTWGNYVYIKHPNNIYSRYAHLKKNIPVKINQEVDENTLIGIIGDSGNTYGRHLHFEVSTKYSSSGRINPEIYLKEPIFKETDNITYQSYDNVKNKWLPNVEVNTDEYAGNFGNGISAIKIDNLKYRVHDKKKGYWLPWVNGREDYAGNLPNDIDGIQIENATYRAHLKNGSWLSWVDKVDNTNNGYAGIYNKVIDAIQIKTL